jgi:hypothetical protein
MNLVAKYHWMHEFETGAHITVSSAFDIHDDRGELLKHFEPGLHGKIIKLNSKENSLSAYFEDDSFFEGLDPNHFTMRRDLDAKQAYNALQKFFGHYSRSDEQLYQFNIKMHGYQIPDSVYQQLGSDKVWDILYEKQDDLLRLFTGKDCDYAPLSFFDWIKEYYTAGKSGGYLMIVDRFATVEAYNEAEYDYLQAKDDYRDHDDYVQSCYDSLVSEEKDLTERVYDLLMIEKLISLYQNNHYQEISQIRFWLEHFEFQRA